MRGGIAATAVLCFVFSWTEFILTIFLANTIQTIPIKVTTFSSWTFGYSSALGTTAMLPSFIFTLLFRRFLVRGLTVGTLKYWPLPAVERMLKHLHGVNLVCVVWIFFNHCHIMTNEECDGIQSPGKLHAIDRCLWGQNLNLRPSGYEPDKPLKTRVELAGNKTASKVLKRQKLPRSATSTAQRLSCENRPRKNLQIR